jgi:tetratricopeptide (TPR) repeat protein
MGGIGKSLLAEEYALRYEAAFPGGVFWLSAFGNDDTKTGMSADDREAAREGQIRQIATTLGIAVEARNPDEIEVAVRLELGKRENPFLWVVDDLPSGTDRETFERWLAPHSLGKTLITTRAKEHDALGVLISLDVLEPEEAYELLTSRRKPKVEGDRGRRRRGLDEKDEESAARGIVEALGCHTLAVDVAGATLYTSSSRTPFVTFLEELADPTDDALEFAADLKWELPTGHETSIASTFLKSIDRLEPEGLDFLRLASRLAVAPIPATLISSVFCEVDRLNERSGRRRADLAVNRAERLSLAERVEGDAGAWSVHTLISRTMRFRCLTEERSSILRDAAVRVLTTAFRENAEDPRDHAELEPVVAHARELADRVDDLETVNLVGRVARYDHERGAYGLAETSYRREWGTTRRILGSEHPCTLASMNNLAETLRAQGDIAEARKIQEEVLEITRRIRGSEHPNTLISMSNLALTLSDLEGARKIQEEVLEITRRIRGSEHPLTLISRSNLAETLWAQGELEGAREIQEDVIEISRRVLGDGHPDTLRSMNNLARTLSDQGELESAREIQEEVLKTTQRRFGGEHFHTLRSMDNLAATLSQQGEFKRARKIQEEELEITRRIRGSEHPDTSVSAWNLLDTTLELGDSDRARAVLENDILWLLDRDPASLGAAQRRIQEQVKGAIG